MRTFKCVSTLPLQSQSQMVTLHPYPTPVLPTTFMGWDRNLERIRDKTRMLRVMLRETVDNISRESDLVADYYQKDPARLYTLSPRDRHRG